MSLRVLSIGHSYVVGANRALMREVARDPRLEVTVAGPAFFHGDLRPVCFDPEPPGSQLSTCRVPARWTSRIHVFRYSHHCLEELLRNGRFDVVHAWEEPYIYAGYQIATAMNGSRARFCFRTAQSYVKWYPPPFSVFERTGLKRAQGWIAGANLVYKAMLQRGYPERRGRVLTLAVDTSVFRPLSSAERSSVLLELGLTPPVVGFVGRFTEAKGLDVLLRAMEQVKRSSDWSLLLLGSGEYGRRIRAWAANRGWSRRVCLRLVKHDEVPRYLGAMDLLVAPSQTRRNWREQFGRMLIEAFACGVPVIGSDSGEIPHVIGDAGRIVAEADVDGWATAITNLLRDPAARAEFAARGLERVQRYSVTSVAQQYRDYFQWLRDQPLS